MKRLILRLLVITSSLFVVNITWAESLPLLIPVDKATLLKGGYNQYAIQSGSSASGKQDGMRHVDIAFFYTPDLLEKLNREEMQAYIEEQTGFANLALKNNNIENLRRKVVFVGEIDIVGHQEMSNSEFRNTFSFHEEKSLINMLYRADYNTVIRPKFDPNICGSGTIGNHLSSGNSSALEVGDGCLFPSLAAHEWGHNDGMDHDIDNAVSTIIQEPFAFGFHCAGKGTIMNVSNEFHNSAGHAFYSSPNILVNGQPCGVEDKADNAHILRLRMQQAQDGEFILYNSNLFETLDGPLSIHGTITFSALPELDVLPFQGSMRFTLQREGDLNPVDVLDNPQPISVEFYTKAISAIPGEDYEITIQRVEFAPGQEFAEVEIPLIDSPRSRNTVRFEVGLRYPLSLEVISEPVIVNLLSERPFTGNAAFNASSQSVAAGSASLTLTVKRSGTTEGELIIPWFIEDVTTTSADYSPGTGELLFADGEETQSIELELPRPNQSQERQFKLILDSADAIAPNELLVTIAATPPPAQDNNSNSDSGGGGSLGWGILLLTLLGLRRRACFTQ
jgi:hypothetical protein